jgi:hypothetical protein
MNDGRQNSGNIEKKGRMEWWGRKNKKKSKKKKKTGNTKFE